MVVGASSPSAGAATARRKGNASRQRIGCPRREAGGSGEEVSRNTRRDQIEIGLQIPIPTVEPLPDRFPVSQSAQRVSGDQSQAFLPVVALWRPLPFPLHVARQLLQMLERNFVVF